MLLRTGWQGLVVIDTKSDLEILTQNALAASDLALVVVADRPSLRQAERVYELMKGWGRPLERARLFSDSSGPSRFSVSRRARRPRPRSCPSIWGV